MLIREGVQLYALVDRWRGEANELSARVRRGHYLDQTSRVIMQAEVRELRRCARNLKRRVDDLHKRHY